MKDLLVKKFGNKIRVRSSGILIIEEKLLLLKHQVIGPNGYYWLPPGGGVEKGETVIDALKREFFEETDIKVTVKNLIKLEEYINLPLHSIEFYFKVLSENHLSLKLGTDPELSNQQLLEEFHWFNQEELKNLGENTPSYISNLDLQKI